MADRNDEDILRAILEKGGDRAKKQAAELLAQQPHTPDTHVEVKQAKAKKRRWFFLLHWVPPMRHLRRL